MAEPAVSILLKAKNQLTQEIGKAKKEVGELKKTTDASAGAMRQGMGLAAWSARYRTLPHVSRVWPG
jgi:hypothetical protein